MAAPNRTAASYTTDRDTTHPTHLLGAFDAWMGSMRFMARIRKRISTAWPTV